MRVEGAGADSLVASTGPRSRERGGTANTGLSVRRSISFNGAALTRARREVESLLLTPALAMLQRGRAHASAEGKPQCQRRGRCHWLQRGRAHASAEGIARSGNGNASRFASTGPRSRERGGQPARRQRTRSPSASTGPRSRERGGGGLQGAALVVRDASTGPRSRERGGREGGDVVVRDPKASTGPRSRERGGSTRKSWEQRRLTLLQRGRAHASAEGSAPRACASGRSSSFNGAALTRARRDSVSAASLWNLDCASTGPRSRERGGHL